MKKKQIENQAQQGRSMVEMLGVLAIIGVISIGGIAGYRMAMNRYQANQIANEINLMRTDAKMKAAMKTAQGAENLMLGEPYDSGHLNLNSHYGVEFDFAVFSEAGEPEESGYYIKISGVPAGVCKPLVTLLEGMDDAIAVVVNEQENNADSSADFCTEESNALEVDFSTKDLGVSGGEKEEACDEATCEGYCSADGACKECPADAPWNEATRQCKCSSNKHWNKEIEECAACGDNSHCTSSSKPACIEGVCSACTEDSQCDTEQNEHCSSSGSCITCGSSASAAAWNETARKCDTCKNVYPENPNWNGSECVATCPADKPVSYSNQCVECRTNSDCDKKGDGKHYWCDTNTNNGTCTSCDDNWDESTQRCKIGQCESNADCGEGEYCYLYYGYSCTSEFDTSKGFGAGSGTYKSECRKAESDINKSGDTNSKYIISTKEMNWWSAKRFCEALGNKRMVSATELECKDKFGEDFGYGKSNTWCYCHAEGSEMACNQSSTSDVSSGVKALRKANNGNENSTASKYLWLSDPYGSSDSSCHAYSVYLSLGSVGNGFRSNASYALCE